MAELIATGVIEQIHTSGRQLVLAITGGGSSVIGDLLEVPGGSRSLLEAIVPYSSAALDKFLGGTPDHYCSEPTARAMGMAAWMRARELSPEADPMSLVGVGVTASLASNVTKRGDHRIHLGLQTATETASLSLTLAKGARSRQEEEQLACWLCLVALAQACGVDNHDARVFLAGQLRENEALQHRCQAARPAWTQLLLGQLPYVVQPDPSDVSPKVVFPGAFHPLHQGHQEMARVAERHLGSKVFFEVSIANVDKPPLEFIEIQDRLSGIEDSGSKWDLLLTTAPTFCQKARLFPGATFVVGVDTVVRIADPKYYGNDLGQRDAAIAEIAATGCRFLVFGRQVGGKFCGLGDVELPAALAELCDEVPEQEFRVDVSSSELRNS